VLKHIVQGKANKAIAREIVTIETHRANLMSKLRIKSVADLVRLTTLQR
jgi:two-component system, LuxR family, response regulator FixJ